jgi:hypothetical protein
MPNTHTYSEQQNHLIIAALYVTIQGHLCSTIIEQVRRHFHLPPQPELPDELDKDYLEAVLIHSDDVFLASCAWLQKNQVLTPEEVEALKNLAGQRDEIVKNFSRPMWGKRLETRREDFYQIAEFFHKVDAWSVKDEYGFNNVDEDDMAPMQEIFAWLVARMAFPDPTEKK